MRGNVCDSFRRDGQVVQVMNLFQEPLGNRQQGFGIVLLFQRFETLNLYLGGLKSQKANLTNFVPIG